VPHSDNLSLDLRPFLSLPEPVPSSPWRISRMPHRLFRSAAIARVALSPLRSSACSKQPSLSPTGAKVCQATVGCANRLGDTQRREPPLAKSGRFKSHGPGPLLPGRDRPIGLRSPRPVPAADSRVGQQRGKAHEGQPRPGLWARWRHRMRTAGAPSPSLAGHLLNSPTSAVRRFASRLGRNRRSKRRPGFPAVRQSS